MPDCDVDILRNGDAFCTFIISLFYPPGRALDIYGERILHERLQLMFLFALVFPTPVALSIEPYMECTMCCIVRQPQ